MSDLAIRSVVFGEDIVEIVYMTPQDVRNGGLVMQSHVLGVSMAPDYADEIEDVLDAIKRLVRDALEDFELTPPVTPTDVVAPDVVEPGEPEDDDDD
jgi:hypothetical protein